MHHAGRSGCAVVADLQAAAGHALEHEREVLAAGQRGALQRDALGAQQLERRSELTPFGREGLQRAKQLVFDADELTASGRRMREGRAGSLRVGMGSGPGAMLMTPLLMPMANSAIRSGDACRPGRSAGAADRAQTGAGAAARLIGDPGSRWRVNTTTGGCTTGRAARCSVCDASCAVQSFAAASGHARAADIFQSYT